MYRVEKSKLSKCLAPLVLLNFFITSTVLSMIQKQLAPCVPGDPFAVLLKNDWKLV